MFFVWSIISDVIWLILDLDAQYFYTWDTFHDRYPELYIACCWKCILMRITSGNKLAILYHLKQIVNTFIISCANKWKMQLKLFTWSVYSKCVVLTRVEWITPTLSIQHVLASWTHFLRSIHAPKVSEMFWSWGFGHGLQQPVIFKVLSWSGILRHFEVLSWSGIFWHFEVLSWSGIFRHFEVLSWSGIFRHFFW